MTDTAEKIIERFTDDGTANKVIAALTAAGLIVPVEPTEEYIVELLELWRDAHPYKNGETVTMEHDRVKIAIASDTLRRRIGEASQ